MIKARKWQGIVLTVLSLLFFIILGFAVGQLVPAGAEEESVLDGQSEYTLFGNPKAEEIYDEETNSYECSTSTLILIQFTTEGRTAKFRYSISADSSSYGVNVYYYTDFDPDNKFSYYSHYGTVGSVKGIETVKPGTDGVGSISLQDGIVTFTGDAEHEYYLINIYASSNPTITVSGLRKPNYYNVTTSVEEDAHGTVTMAGDTTGPSKTSLSTKVCSGKPIAMTAKPDEGYFPIWKDKSGAVVARGDSYTPNIGADSEFTVSFEKLGDNNLLVTYDSHDGENQFKWQNVDGKYSIANPGITPTVTEQTQSSSHIDFHVNGAAILTFDYSLLRASNEEHCFTKTSSSFLTGSSSETIVSRKEGNPAHWTKALVLLDGVNVPATTTIKYMTHQKNAQPLSSSQNGVPAGEYNNSVNTMNIGLGRTGAANSGSSDTQSISVYVDSAGSHTLEIRFITAPYIPSEGDVPQYTYGVEHEDERPDKVGEAFSFGNVQLTEKTARTFTLKYDEELGEIATEGLGVSEGEPCEGGKTFKLYDDFSITLTATAKKGVTSSLDETKTVDAHFISWTSGSRNSESTSCTLEFKEGKLYFNDQPVEGTEVSALFEEDVVAPAIWTKINDSLEGGSDPQQVTGNKQEISIDFSTAEQKSLFVLFGEYGEGDTIKLFVNGQTTSAMAVDKTGDLGVVDGVLTDEMKSSFATNTVNWWLAQELGTQYEIKISISKEGYVGTVETVIYVTYTTGDAIVAKTPEGLPEGAIFAKDYSGNDVKSVFNHLFTDESEGGAYFATTSTAGWSSTAEFDGGETKTPVFEGMYDSSKHDKMTENGMSQDHWSVSMLQIRDYYVSADKKYVHYQGVLSFDVYLEVRKNAGIATRDAVILVERKDDYNNISKPESHDGNGVITEKVSNTYIDGQSIQAANSDLIGLVDHKSNVAIWTGNTGESNNFVTALGDGWYRCVIPTVRESEYQSSAQRELEQVDGKYVHQTSEFRLIFATHPDAEARYAIRNVSFRRGTEANFKFSVNDNTYQGNVTAQAGENLTLGQDNTLSFGSTVTLTATVPDGKKFYGWELISADEKSSYLPSTSVETNKYTLRYTLIDPVEIKAWFGTETEFSARSGGKYYATLNNALDAVKANGGDIYLIRNTTIEESLVIPQNVRVIIPFDESGAFMGSAATGHDSQKRIAWAEQSLVNKYRYLTITLGENVQIEIEGGLYLGGVVNYADQGYQGHTSGAYSELILKKDSKIIVKNGGVFDVYGRVWGGEEATGMGTITAEKGAKVYEPFLILDFSGGSITLDLFTENITPFKRYAMINIECPMTINYGAQLIGHATLYVAQFGEFYALDQPFISDDKNGETMIMLKDGGNVTITYDPAKIVGDANLTNCTELIGQTKLVFNGGAKFSYMKFSQMGLTVPTFGVYFSIPYNFDIELNGDKAQYETVTDFMIMPGAKVTVGVGATLTLHANAWVYGGFYAPANAANKSYPTADQLDKGGYSKSGHLIVNGKLVIDKKWVLDDAGKPVSSGATAATFLGIIETNGKTGRIEIATGTILRGTIKDGTEKSKNYFAYTTTARVWVKTGESTGKFIDLVAGHNYTAKGSDAFTLEKLMYTTTEGGAETSELALKTDMVGSWMLEHSEHQYDWKTKEGKNPSESEPWVEMTGTCTVDGCDHEETKYLLYKFDSITSQTYKGTAFTTEELANLFKAMYNKTAELPAGVTVTASCSETVQNVKQEGQTYQVTITLKGAWFLDGTDRKESATLSFTVNKKDVTLEVKDQTWAVYNGQTQEAHKVAGTDYNLTGVCNNENIDFSFVIENNAAKAGSYELTVTLGNNPNYNVTPKYPSAYHATFTINKATLKVTVSGQSAKGDELAYTIHVEGYVNGEKNLLDEDGNWQQHFTITPPEGFSKDSEPNGYEFDVKYNGGELDNYKVECEAKGTYTITESVYKGITFVSETIVYDGETHTFAVKGADEGFTVQYTCGETKDSATPFAEKDVGEWTITATITKEGHAALTLQATFKINARTVTVEILGQGKAYDGENASVTNVYGTDWKLAEGSEMGKGDEATSLNVTLSVGNYKNVGSYDITGTANAGSNYEVKFGSGEKKYTITPKEITATAKDVTTTYGEEIVATKSAVEFEDGAIVEGDTIPAAVDLTQVQQKFGTYTIGITITNATKEGEAYLYGNYKITVVTGTWTVEKKAITIVITPVEVTYSGAEPAAPTAWTFKAGSALVNGDENKDLHVVLTKEAGVNAGSYDITGAWTNENYDVTFEGEEDAYTVNKKDISEEGNFWITGEGVNEEGGQGGRLVATYAGEDIDLTGYVLLGSETLEVELVLTPDKITGIGDFDVTVTVDDVNYSGSKTFHLVVTNADGYTKKLVDTLAELAELTEGMTAETLKAEDFEALKEAAELIAALDDEEKDVAEEQLAAYEALIAAWNESAEGLDAKIETAQSIGDALLDGLFGVAATVSALAAVAFVLRKGGIL